MKFQYLTPPTMETWKQIGNFLREEGWLHCTVALEDYTCKGRHEEGHHGIWGGDYSKSKSFKKYADVLVNYQPVCHNCNVGTRRADTRENRRWFINRQYQLGFDVLEEWMKLPKKFREANKEIERMIRQEM